MQHVMNPVHRTWWKTTIGVILTAIMLFPVYWMVNVSLTKREAIRDGDLIPKAFTLEHYGVVLSDQLPYLLTSLVVGLGTVLLTLAISAPAGFALSRLVRRGNRMLSFVLIVAQ